MRSHFGFGKRKREGETQNSAHRVNDTVSGGNVCLCVCVCVDDRVALRASRVLDGGGWCFFLQYFNRKHDKYQRDLSASTSPSQRRGSVALVEPFWCGKACGVFVESEEEARTRRVDERGELRKRAFAAAAAVFFPGLWLCDTDV